MVMILAEPDDERLKRQRNRSIAIALVLGALVLLFYAATIVRLGPNALRKGQISGPTTVVPTPKGTNSPDVAGPPERRDQK
jgi:hypothetical protein